MQTTPKLVFALSARQAFERVIDVALEAGYTPPERSMEGAEVYNAIHKWFESLEKGPG